jgi:hypothetical protein
VYLLEKISAMRFIYILLIIWFNLTLIPIDAETLKGVIGDTDLSFNAVSIDKTKKTSFSIPKGSSIICIQEIYPDTPDQPTYTYDLFVQNRLVYVREHKGTGFGPVSYFVYLPTWARNATSIQVVNRGKSPVKIASIRSISESQLANVEKNDQFGLYGVLVTHHGWHKGKQFVEELAAKMPCKPGFYRGFSFELPYASLSPNDIAELISHNVQWAKQYNLAYFPGFTSWWASTPLRVPDGEGGFFGDIKYQQICWSPEDTEHSEQLKQLLGSRYSVHYGLSIPNQWSNCPWLTLNHPKLNEHRQKTLISAVRLLASKIKHANIHLEGIYLENEPRYWDSYIEAGNPKSKRKTVWADFNPVVVADAMKDGVVLDPSDGLDYKERLWLHRNVARYMQNTVNWALEALKSSNLQTNVYTHSLQIMGFPGDEIGHPMSEFAYVSGAYVGLEGMWMKLADLERVREWGPWANVNREEGDGKDIREHLWDLRVTYARGGKLYNSYNWQNIGSDRVFGYINEFLNNLPLVEVPSPGVASESNRRLTFTTSLEVKAANLVKLSVKLSKDITSALLLSVKDPTGRTIGFSRVEGPFKSGMNTLTFRFSEPFEINPGERGSLHLWAENQKYNPFVEAVDASFFFDLRRERNQSLVIIESSRRK